MTLLPLKPVFKKSKNACFSGKSNEVLPFEHNMTIKLLIFSQIFCVLNYNLLVLQVILVKVYIIGDPSPLFLI